MTTDVTYIAFRKAEFSCVLLVEVRQDGKCVRRSQLHHHVRHSPTGLEWGYEGSGPADTARSILFDALRRLHPEWTTQRRWEAVSDSYQTFKREIVAGWRRDVLGENGRVSLRQIDDWLSWRSVRRHA